MAAFVDPQALFFPHTLDLCAAFVAVAAIGRSVCDSPVQCAHQAKGSCQIAIKHTHERDGPETIGKNPRRHHILTPCILRIYANSQSYIYR